MRSFGYPVIFDGTHSVQIPGGAGTTSSGKREFVEYLVRAAVGVGIDGLFLEVHDNPEEALSDGPNMVYLDHLEEMLKDALAIHEIVNILPVIRRIGAVIVAMCGRRDSSLGKNCDYFVDISVEREACPLGLAPTASTTATLAMGDAMAMALMAARNFTSQDFAMFHPGGALGRKLLLTVEHVMHSGEDNPLVRYDKTAKDALFVMTEKGLGAASVVDEKGKFVGLITDGIIRRALGKDNSFLDEPVEHIMTAEPLTITKDKLAAAALSVMEKHKPRPVTVLPVVDADRNPVGIVHLTDLLRQGVV